MLSNKWSYGTYLYIFLKKCDRERCSEESFLNNMLYFGGRGKEIRFFELSGFGVL